MLFVANFVLACSWAEEAGIPESQQMIKREGYLSVYKT